MIHAIQVASLSAALLLCGCGPEAEMARPNIVLIISDYMGYGDTQPYGATDVATPSLQRLAAEGVRFTDFHAAAPLCGPSRASLLTGLYPARAGIESNVEGDYPGLAPEHTTLARRLSDIGYDTALIGKWHLGTGASGPIAHGFQRFLGFHDSSLDYYDHTTVLGEPGLWEGGQLVSRQGYLTDVLTEEALDFVRSPRDRPYFLYLAYNTALPPYQPPGLPVDQRADRWEDASREDYAAMIEAMDAGIGRVLAAVDESGSTDETLVVFTTDHGGGLLSRADPHIEGLLSLREGGVRVPLLLRWPGELPAGVVSEQLGISMDLSVTLLEAAGVDETDVQSLDGESLIPVVAGTQPASERTLFWRQPAGELVLSNQELAAAAAAEANDGVAAVSRPTASLGDDMGIGAWACRRGRWKFLYVVTAMGPPRGYLYDLEADPGESTNLLREEPEVRGALSSALKAWDDSLPPMR